MLTHNLSSIEGNELLIELIEPLRLHLIAVDANIGLGQAPEIVLLNEKLTSAREVHHTASDKIIDDIFVLDRYLYLFSEYGLLWKQIASSHFSESWRTLQNAFDAIRLIKRFSNIDVSAIEDQLCDLEILYPYKIFASMGMVVERFECSICGEDIDSFMCIHLRGELYRGTMAFGIARKILDVDHIALVEQPVDKRNVISYGNDAPHFSAVSYLSKQLTTRAISVSRFIGVIRSKSRVSNENHRKVGRNNPCYCGSGEKYKKCCVDKAVLEQENIEIIYGDSIIDRAIAP
jgi:hypothetical protein